VAAENSSTTTIGQAEPFLGNNVIVAPGMVKAEEVRPAAAAVATEDEETLWEGLYSSKNFLGRAVLGGTLAAAWVLVALYTWSFGHPNFTLVTYAPVFSCSGFFSATSTSVLAEITITG
jgi:hypothetical protein